MKDLAVIRLLQQANDAEARYAQTADQSDLEAALTAWAGLLEACQQPPQPASGQPC